MAYEFKTPPFEHQRTLLEETWDREAFALFWEMGCVDAETEFLSPSGWVRMDAYDGSQRVAQYDPDTGHARFVEPLRYVKAPCPEMIRIRTARGLDQLLSPDHRMLLRTRTSGGRSPRFYDLEASDFFTRYHDGSRPFAHETIPTAFEMRHASGASIDLTDDEVRLQVAVIADGHFPSSSPHTNRCIVRLKKERKVARLRALLAATGIEARERYESSTGFRIFTFRAPRREKDFSAHSWWICSYEHRQIVASEALLWDGSIPDDPARSSHFFSRCKSSADFVQFCFVSTGHRASIAFDEKRGDYRLTVSGTRSHFVSPGCNPDSVRTEPSPDGFKYCFTVPSSYLVLRRNGRVFITGNCGKSWVVINTAGRLFEAEEIDALVVIAPKGVYRNWLGEIEMHLPDRIERRVAVWSPETTKKKASELARVMAPCESLRVLLVNVEALSTTRCQKRLEAFLRASRALLVVDESTWIKTPKAKRTESIVDLAQLALYRRILTGSAVTKNPLDLFSQCEVLGHGMLGFRSFYSYKARHALTETIKISHPTKAGTKTRNIEKVVGFQRIDELKEKLQGFSQRLLKTDCLDLPPKLYERREVDLSDEQETLYREIRERSRAELAGESRVTAPMVITRMLRLHQVVCGFVKTDDGLEVPLSSKRDLALLDVLEETSGKAIVWAPFRFSIQRIAALLCEKYGSGSTVTYFGDTSDEARSAAIECFQHDPDCRFFVGNAQTAGFGLTLTAASTVIYFANSHRLEDRLQSEDRAHRIGQRRSAVTYVDLVAPGTVDERIIRSLRAKKRVAGEVLGEEWKEWI